MKLSGLFLTAALSLAGQVFATNYTGWYSRSIVINPATAGISGTVSSFPLLVRLNAGNFTFSQSLSDIVIVPTTDVLIVPTVTNYTAPGGSDVRFTAADGTTDLPFQVERWDGVKKLAEIWVLVPSVSASGNTTLKMFWGGNGTAAAPLPSNDSGPTAFAPVYGFQTVHHLVDQISSSVSEPSSTILDPSQFVMQKASGTSIVGVVADSSIIGFGATLDGVATAYSINSSKNNILTDYQSNSTYTLSAWAKNTNTAATQSRIISKSGEFYLGTNVDGSKWEMAEYEDNAGTQTVDVPTDTGWNYLAGVRNGTAMTLYVNGTSSSGMIHTDTTHAPRPTSSSVAPNLIQTVGIGREVGSTLAAPTQGLYFKGSLDEVRLENVSRNADWIALNYATQKASVTAVTYGTVTAPAALRVADPSSAAGLSFRLAGSSMILTLPAISGTAQVSMMDLQGRVVWSRSVNAGTHEVSVEGASSLGVLPGLYIVRLAARDANQMRIAAESKVLLTP